MENIKVRRCPKCKHPTLQKWLTPHMANFHWYCLNCGSHISETTTVEEEVIEGYLHDDGEVCD